MHIKVLATIIISALLQFSLCSTNNSKALTNNEERDTLVLSIQNINEVLFYCQQKGKKLACGEYLVNDAVNTHYFQYGTSTMYNAKSATKWLDSLRYSTMNDTLFFLENIDNGYYANIWNSKSCIYIKQNRNRVNRLVNRHVWYEIKREKKLNISQEIEQHINNWDVEWLISQQKPSGIKGGAFWFYLSRVIINDNTVVSCQTIRINDIFW